MALPIAISFHHFEPTDLIRERLDRLVEELEAFSESITSGRVVVDGTNRHGHKVVVEIAVELSIPGGMAVGKRTAEFPSPAGQRSFDKAATEAFKVAVGQVKSHMEKMRGHEVKTSAADAGVGRIGKLNRTVNNGFIEMASGESLFFSADVLDGSFDDLSEGDSVLVKIADGEGPYGPQASHVKPTAPMEKVR